MLCALLFNDAHADTVKVTDATFYNMINENKVVFVYFYAGWCGPCRMLTPQIVSLSNTYPEIVFATYDTDQESSIAQIYSVQAMPTTFIFVDGEKVAQVVGANLRQVQNYAATYAAIASGPAKYSISYVLNGGTNYSGAPSQYTEGTGATINGVPTRSGYTFTGWCTDSGLTNCAMSQTISSSASGNKTFYAKWLQCTACSATNANCSISVSNNTCVYTTSCYTGYGDIQNAGQYNPSCSPNEYSVTYSCGAGNGTPPPDDIAVYDGSFLPADNTCTKDGYVFTGWMVSNTNDVVNPAEFDWHYAENKTLTARWSHPYTITYSCGDGTGTPPVTETALGGLSFTPAANTCSKSGYGFIGWGISGTNDVSEPGNTFTYNYDEDKTLTAQYWQYKFDVTTISLPSSMNLSFYISATGTFYVDCGDGGTLSGNGVSGNKITRTNTAESTYTCAYSSSGVKTIHIGGLATGYNTSSTVAAIRFYGSNPGAFASISGSLSKIFPQLGNNNGQTPRFYQTFRDTFITAIPETLFSDITTGVPYLFYRTFYGTKITTIPSNLFANITTAANYMFDSTFAECYSLTTIPSNLFANITTGADYMFNSTFAECNSLTTIPSNLFANITTGAERMFYRTFSGTHIQSIPAGLFSNITTGANYMFYATFYECNSLTTIPSNLFANITTGANHMFDSTFAECDSLTTIPSNLFANITTGANYMFNSTFAECYSLTTIPSNLFANITTGTEGMFYRTFSGTHIQSIPAGLFSNITTGANYMFDSTFAECYSLTTIPSNLFANITTGANYMFDSTFAECNSLTTIPSNLFANITTGANYMFSATFYECNSLTTIPSNLFANITTSAEGMFYRTFYDCDNLSGYIPSTTFAGLIANGSPTTSYMWGDTFTDTQLLTSCPSETMPYITGYESAWNNKVSCQDIIPITCSPGKYLDAYDAMCHDCPTDNYCTGGTYTYDGTDIGITTCPNDLYSPMGSSSSDQCGHILHVGDDVVYLRSVKQTTPSLNVKVGDNIYYGNMTPQDVFMHDGADHKLKIQFDDVTYSLYDDTITVE